MLSRSSLFVALVACGGCTGTGTSGSPAPMLPSVPLPWVGVAADGSAAGTVRDVDGAPVAGAQVCAFHPVPMQLPQAAQQPVCVASGVDGGFVITGLVPAAYDVHASAAGFRPAALAEQTPVRAGQRAEGLELALAPGGVALRGRVRDVHGRPIAGAQVTNSRGDREAKEQGAWAVGRTDAAGEFALWVSDGPQSISAEARGYTPSVEWTDTALGPIEVVMAPESTIAGTVIDAATRAPIAGARVQVFVERPAPPVILAATAYTDAAGAFRVEGLAPGRYEVRAQTGNRDGAGDRVVRLGLGEERTLPALALASLPSLRMHAPEGRCVAGWVESLGDGWREPIGVDGQVFVPALTPGIHHLEVYCDEYSSKELMVTMATTPLAGIVWEEGYRARPMPWGPAERSRPVLRATLVDVNGAPIRGVTVWGEPYAGPLAISDAAGRVVLREAPPDSTLRVQAPGGEAESVAIDAGGVARLVRSGVVRPIGGRVLAAGAPRAGAVVVATETATEALVEQTPSWQLHEFMATTDADGRFTLPGTFGPAPYALRAFVLGGGEAAAPVVVHGGGAVTIEVPALATIAGTVTGTRRFAVGLVDETGQLVARRRFERTDGRFGFEAVAPGAYTLQVVSREGCAAQAVTVGPGERREDVALTTGPVGGLRGTVRKRGLGVGGVGVWVRPRDEAAAALLRELGDAEATSDADSAFTTLGLCPGQVHVQASAPGVDRTDLVRIEAGAFTQLNLELEP